jgi:triosephosphate isomerase
MNENELLNRFEIENDILGAVYRQELKKADGVKALCGIGVNEEEAKALVIQARAQGKKRIAAAVELEQAPPKDAA